MAGGCCPAEAVLGGRRKWKDLPSRPWGTLLLLSSGIPCVGVGQVWVARV